MYETIFKEITFQLMLKKMILNSRNVLPTWNYVHILNLFPSLNILTKSIYFIIIFINNYVSKVIRHFLVLAYQEKRNYFCTTASIYT
jgi:hypothetical protein